MQDIIAHIDALNEAEHEDELLESLAEQYDLETAFLAYAEERVLQESLL